VLSKSIFGGHGGRRRLAACAAALGTAVLVTGLTGVPAMAASNSAQHTAQHSASDQAAIIELVDFNTGLCLTSNSPGSVSTQGCNFTNSQEWYNTVPTGFPVPGGAFGTGTMGNVQTGQCLDSNFAGDVYTSPCDGNNSYENWSEFENGPLAFQYQNWETGLCLDSNAAGDAYTYPCNWNDSFQNWWPYL
jgi:Ricin-type beta-trefoil lectin domain